MAPIRLCDRCADSVAHIHCVRLWGRSRSALGTCPTCRGPLTEPSALLMSASAAAAEASRASAFSAPHLFCHLYSWPMVLFVMQVSLGFVMLSVSVEAAHVPGLNRALPSFARKVFASDVAVLAYVLWRYDLFSEGGAGTAMARHNGVHRIADLVTVASSAVAYILYEAEILLLREQLPPARARDSPLQTGTVLYGSVQGAYLLLAYVVLYTFMLGAMLSRQRVWRMQFVWFCFLYACVITCDGQPADTHVIFGIVAASWGFGTWILCSTVLATGPSGYYNLGQERATL